MRGIAVYTIDGWIMVGVEVDFLGLLSTKIDNSVDQKTAYFSLLYLHFIYLTKLYVAESCAF